MPEFDRYYCKSIYQFIKDLLMHSRRMKILNDLKPLIIKADNALFHETSGFDPYMDECYKHGFIKHMQEIANLIEIHKSQIAYQIQVSYLNNVPHINQFQQILGFFSHRHNNKLFFEEFYKSLKELLQLQQAPSNCSF